jgi:hypothetical protein
MANIKISQLSPSSPLSGSEELPIVQSATTVKTTIQDILNLSSGGLGTLDVVTSGTIGQDINVSYDIKSVIDGSISGTQLVPINLTPSISVNSMSMTPDLQSIAFTNLIAVNNFSIGGYSLLSSVSVPSLTRATSIALNNVNNLNTLSFPSLTSISSYIDFSAYSPVSLSIVNFQSLTTARFQFYGSYLGINQIDSFYFPALTSFSGVIFPQNITTIDLPIVTTLRNFEDIQITTYSPTLTSVLFPSVIDIKSSNINIAGNSGLFDIVLGVSGTLKSCKDYTTINLTDNAITDSDKIDDILVLFASLDGTNGTTLSYGGYLYLQGLNMASPGPAGIAAISILTDPSRGWQVNTN